MIYPEHLKPGDRVSIYGFRDLTMGERTGGTYMRRGRFTRMVPCRAEVYEIKFDAGYIEHWDRRGLIYALNNHSTPTSYAPYDGTPEQHVLYLDRKKNERN